jgi:hypothetical protein
MDIIHDIFKYWWKYKSDMQILEPREVTVEKAFLAGIEVGKQLHFSTPGEVLQHMRGET